MKAKHKDLESVRKNLMQAVVGKHSTPKDLQKIMADSAKDIKDACELIRVQKAPAQ